MESNTGNMLSCHMSPEKSLAGQIQRLSKQGINCAQIYLGNNRTYRGRPLSRGEEKDLAPLKSDFHMYVHANYPVHVAYPIESSMSKDSILYFKEVLPYTRHGFTIVTHIAKGPSTSIEHINDNLDCLSLKSDSKRPTLCLENAAGQKNEKGVTCDEMRRIFESIDRTSSLGICLDTQHIFAAGECSFEREEWRKVYEDFRALAPIPFIHLNDSLRTFSSGVDRHADIGQGYIWNRDYASLIDVFEVAEDDHLDLILETPNPDINNVLRMIKSEKEYRKVLQQAEAFGKKAFKEPVHDHEACC
jgi:deoxyribonuclease-4